MSDPVAMRTRIESLARARVLVVGDLVADHYVYGQTDRVSREAPVLIVRYEASDVKLGGAANAAANVRSLGGQVTALGVLGDDEMGAALRRECEAAGIGLEGVSGPGVATETKMRILAGGMNTTRQQMLRVDRGNRTALGEAVERELVSRLRDQADGADVVLVSDYGAGVIGGAVRAALAELAGAGKRVCVDSRYSLREFRGMTVCKPNEPELEALTGIALGTEDSFRRAARQALVLLGCEVLLVTRGHNGMALFERSGAEHLLPVHGQRDAVDVTGAGDTVIAVFSLAVAAGASYLEAAELANVAGALVVQKQGTATVSPGELGAELASG